jgi:hypothetical protein
MITSFKINNYDILSDDRVAPQISGLSPVDSAPSTVTSGGSKRITSTVRSNRSIQVTGYIKRDVESVAEQLYSNWLIGEKLKINVIANDNTYTEDCIVQDIFIDRYKSLVTFTIRIVCYSAFLYKEETEYTANNEAITVLLDECNIPQHNIIISHLIQANETAFTVDFYGVTNVTLDGDYSGQTAVIDCLEQTCYIDGVNKFYLVSEWQDGETKETGVIPINTTVKYKKIVRGVW